MRHQPGMRLFTRVVPARLSSCYPSAPAFTQGLLPGFFTLQNRPFLQVRSQHVVPVGRRSAPQGTGLDLIFSEKDVPPLQFWDVELARKRILDVTPGKCLEAAAVYCSVASKNSSVWERALEKEHGIDAWTLHTTASALIGGPPGPTWSLGLHMLGTASNLGYDPSTLTLARLLSRTSGASSAKVLANKRFRDAEARFRRLVATGADPDALTLQGILLARETRPSEALAFFERAVRAGAGGRYAPVPVRGDRSRDSEREVPALVKDAGGSDGPADKGLDEAPLRQSQGAIRPLLWNWEISCHLERGRIYLARGDYAVAAAAFRIAALELDAAAGYLELGRMLPDDTAEKETYLTKAAVSGGGAACRLLGELHGRKAREAGLAKKDVENHRRLSTEWIRLSDASDEAIEA